MNTLVSGLGNLCRRSVRSWEDWSSPEADRLVCHLPLGKISETVAGFGVLGEVEALLLVLVADAQADQLVDHPEHRDRSARASASAVRQLRCVPQHVGAQELVVPGLLLVGEQQRHKA